MNMELCEEATAFGAAALTAFCHAGGYELVQAAERDPGSRTTRIEPAVWVRIVGATYQPRSGTGQEERHTCAPSSAPDATS